MSNWGFAIGRKARAGSVRDAGPNNRFLQILAVPPSTPASFTMFNLASRSSQAWRSIQRLAKGMASVSPRIGDTKVSMSLLETGAYINYQRIEDNLAIVRDRYFYCF